MAITGGDVIEAKAVYARQGIVVIPAGTTSYASINLSTTTTYMMLCQMATTGNACGICIIYYDSSWKAQWVFDKTSAAVSGQMTISFSSNVMTITNKNSGVQIRCLIFCNNSSGWSYNTGTNTYRTSQAAANQGDVIRANHINNTRRLKNIAANASYTIALANYAPTAIFYFAKMGSGAYHQTGFFWYVSDGWHHAVMSSADKTNGDPTVLPTITISGTNVTVRAGAMDCRFAWFEVI